jgi:hypothetical protein
MAESRPISEASLDVTLDGSQPIASAQDSQPAPDFDAKIDGQNPAVQSAAATFPEPVLEATIDGLSAVDAGSSGLDNTLAGAAVSLRIARQSGPSFPVQDWDRYELVKLLGRGGMGSVYEARDKRLGRSVALKFITNASPETTARFMREARAQSRIDHPNVCKVHEVGEVDGKSYIAMQLVAGESLDKAARTLSQSEKVQLLRDVAMALHTTHELGIIHRDIKPSSSAVVG